MLVDDEILMLARWACAVEDAYGTASYATLSALGGVAFTAAKVVGPVAAGAGREVDTLSADYLVAQFERLGLQPGNDGSWFQDVAMVVTTADETTSSAIPLFTGFMASSGPAGTATRIRNAIIDRDVFIPRGAVIGYDLEEDRKRHAVTERGVVVVTSNSGASTVVPTPTRTP